MLPLVSVVGIVTHLETIVACPRSGLLHAGCPPLERAAARVCREAGALLWSMRVTDGCIEVIAKGLPLLAGLNLQDWNPITVAAGADQHSCS